MSSASRSFIVSPDPLGGDPLLGWLCLVHLQSDHCPTELDSHLAPLDFHVLLELHQCSEFRGVVVDQELVIDVSDVRMLTTDGDVADSNLALMSSTLS